MSNLEEELLESLGAISPDEISFKEASFSREEVKELAQHSLDFFAALAMPYEYKYSYPPVFLAIWDWLRSYAHQERTFPKLALGIPRGFSKTTLAKLFCLYCILFTKKKFIYILCATAPKAEAFIADVVDMLDQVNIKKTFGDWRLGLVKNTQEVKQFSLLGRTIIIAGDGAQGKGIRGINLKNARPDVMIFDDIQTREDAESATESEKIYRWMLGTAMYAKAYDGCMFLFIANMYPTENSLLRKLKHNPAWVKFISGGILESGESLWEELQPVSQLLEEYEHDVHAGHPEIFLSEVMNDENVNLINTLDINKIPIFDVQAEGAPDGKYIIIDPATGKPGTNNVAIGLFYLYDTKPVLVKIVSDTFSPLEAIKKVLSICAEEGCRAVFIESAAYQATFLFWFNYVCDLYGISGIDLFELFSRVRKNIRIRDGYKKLVAGDIGISQWAAPIIKSKLKIWNPNKKDNQDDELDLIGYADYPLQEHKDLLSYDYLQEPESFIAYPFNDQAIYYSFPKGTSEIEVSSPI